MPYPVKGLLEVYEDMVEILLMLQVFLAEDPEIEYLFCGAPSALKPAYSSAPGFNCWFSSAPVFQWCCSTPQGSPGVGRNTFLSSPHLCFIIVFICKLFVSRDDPLMS